MRLHNDADMVALNRRVSPPFSFQTTYIFQMQVAYYDNLFALTSSADWQIAAIATPLATVFHSLWLFPILRCRSCGSAAVALLSYTSERVCRIFGSSQTFEWNMPFPFSDIKLGFSTGYTPSRHLKLSCTYKCRWSWNVLSRLWSQVLAYAR